MWDVSNVTEMEFMFWNSQFTGDISKWKMSKAKYIRMMFENCPIPKKHKPKLKLAAMPFHLKAGFMTFLAFSARFGPFLSLIQSFADNPIRAIKRVIFGILYLYIFYNLAIFLYSNY
jgi:hypothetical protein